MAADGQVNISLKLTSDTKGGKDVERSLDDVEKEAAATRAASVATSTPKAADGLAKTLDRASKFVAELGDKSKASSQQIAGVVRSFAGLGIGMAQPRRLLD